MLLFLKNMKNEKKELSLIQEEDSKIVQSGFMKKEDNFKIDFIEKEKKKINYKMIQLKRKKKMKKMFQN